MPSPHSRPQHGQIYLQPLFGQLCFQRTDIYLTLCLRVFLIYDRGVFGHISTIIFDQCINPINQKPFRPIYQGVLEGCVLYIGYNTLCALFNFIFICLVKTKCNRKVKRETDEKKSILQKNKFKYMNIIFLICNNLRKLYHDKYSFVATILLLCTSE